MSDLSAAYAYLQIFRSSLKRKLEDNGSLDSSDGRVAMRKPSPFSISPIDLPFFNVDRSISSCSSSSSSSSFSFLFSPSTLHFFVRADSRTLVLHASPPDTIASVIDQIRLMTGFSATSDLRLIYGSRQLDPNSTLAACGVKTDASLHLTSRLRSTRFPCAWRLVEDLTMSVHCLVSTPLEISDIDAIIKEFLKSVPAAAINWKIEESTIEYLQVFILGCAPAMLAKLYLSSFPAHKATAEHAISLFLNPDAEFLPKCIQIQCWPIVLQFCKSLAASVGKGDRLYVSCRSTLGSLLEALGPEYCVGDAKGENLVLEVFPFLRELFGIVVSGLSSESMFVSSSELGEFANFLAVMRRAIGDCLGGKGQVRESMLERSAHARYEVWIDALREMFAKLLDSVDACLKKVGDFLAENGSLHSDDPWASWSHILVVLTIMHSFSKIYESAPMSLHDFLLRRRVLINALIRRAKRNEDLRWLLKYKDVTDFESRRNLALMLFPEGKDDYGHFHEMLIDRSQLLPESFEYIGQVDAHALHGALFMEFKNEEATGPGVLREWFSLVCRAIFNPQAVLFVPCPFDRRRFFPNPASVVDPLHLKYFGFCGRIIALALMHKVQVGIVFDRSFFSRLAGKIVTLEDVKDADPFLYMSCKKILEMDAELLDSDVLGLTFVREIKELGTQRTIELCPGGEDIIVNSKNREEYVKLLIQHRFMTSVSEQVNHFARGFIDILSKTKFQKHFFSSLDLEDFDRMIGGSNDVINVKDWKSHIEYNGYKAKDRQICWFWKVVEEMSEEQKRLLLFFWTSVRYLPVNGFGGLGSKLYIYKTSDSHDHLPRSHTCFYRLCLPLYKSISMMRDRLQFITQEHVSCTFGMW